MSISNKQKHTKKVVLLGSPHAGKTSLICRYNNDIYTNGLSTIGCPSHFFKQWGNTTISIWDTAGLKVWSSLTNMYCRGANAVILCYDITERLTFDEIEEKHERILDSVADNCVIVLVGTKLDLLNAHSDAVSVDEAMSASLYYTEMFDSLKHPEGRLPIFETSSKNNIQVKQLFEFVFGTLAPHKREQDYVAYNPQAAITSDGKSKNEKKMKKCY